MKKTLLLLALFSFLSFEMIAQEKEMDTEEEMLIQYDDSKDPKEVKNVVKLGLLSLPYGRFNLNYERVFNEKMTLNVLVGIQVPRSFSGFETTNQTEAQRIKSTNYNAFGVTPTLRFYPKSTKMAPRGFYLGPYLSHNRNLLVFDMEYDEQNSGQTYGATMNLDFVGTGAGFTIGTQWLIGDRVSIDWNYLGIGIAYQAIDLLYVSDDQNADYQQIKDDIDAEIANSPYWSGKVTTEVNNEGLVAKAKGITPMFKTSISIGYAF